MKFTKLQGAGNGEAFERKFVSQSKTEDRTIEETLELGWNAKNKGHQRLEF